MAVYSASVYLGRCNDVRILLNAERDFDWAAVLGMSARVGDVTIDSTTHPDLIKWAEAEGPDGGLEVTLRLGAVLSDGMNENLELTVRYVGCDAGHVWVPARGGPDQLRVRSFA